MKVLLNALAHDVLAEETYYFGPIAIHSSCWCGQQFLCCRSKEDSSIEVDVACAMVAFQKCLGVEREEATLEDALKGVASGKRVVDGLPSAGVSDRGVAAVASAHEIDESSG